MAESTVTVKKGDFVEIEYTGELKEESLVFDTTNKEIAEKNDIFNPNVKYEPAIICIGEKQTLEGLDEALEGKELNKEYSVEIPPEKGFGKKNAKLYRLVPSSVFRKQNIKTFPGLQVNIDGVLGTVKTASGGRCVVDFNHPFAGKNLIYKFNILKKVDDDKEKILSYLEHGLRQEKDKIKVEITEGTERIAKIKLQKNVLNEVKDKLSERLKELIPSIKEIKFE